MDVLITILLSVVFAPVVLYFLLVNIPIVLFGDKACVSEDDLKQCGAIWPYVPPSLKEMYPNNPVYPPPRK